MKNLTILLCVVLAACNANPIASDSTPVDSSSSLSQQLPLILQRIKDGFNPDTIISPLSDFIGVVKNATEAAARTKTGQLAASKLKTFTSKLVKTLGDATETTKSGLKNLQAFVKKRMQDVSGDVEHVLQVIGEGGKYLGNGTEEGRAGVLKFFKFLVADDVGTQDDVVVAQSPVLDETDPSQSVVRKVESGKGNFDVGSLLGGLGYSGGKGESSGSKGDFDVLKSLGKMGSPGFPWGGASDSKGDMDLGGVLKKWGKIGDLLSPDASKNGSKTGFDLGALMGGSKYGNIFGTKGDMDFKSLMGKWGDLGIPGAFKNGSKTGFDFGALMGGYKDGNIFGSKGDMDFKKLLGKWGDLGIPDASKNGSKTGFDLGALMGGPKVGNIFGSKGDMDFKSLLGKWGGMKGISNPDGKSGSSGSIGGFDVGSLKEERGGMGDLPSFGDMVSGDQVGIGDLAVPKNDPNPGSDGDLGTLVRDLKGMWGKSDQGVKDGSISGPKGDFDFGNISDGIKKINDFNEKLLSNIFKFG